MSRGAGWCLAIWPLLIACVAFLPAVAFAQDPSARDNAADRLCPQYSGQLIWWGDSIATAKREALLSVIRACDALGLDGRNYQLERLEALHQGTSPMSNSASTADCFFSTMAYTFCKDLYAGRDIGRSISYDAFSAAYAARDEEHILAGLQHAGTREELLRFIRSLEPSAASYLALKQGLTDTTSLQHARSIALSLNVQRWIWHFKLDSFIVINIPSATLKYYKRDSLILSMRTVVGKPETRTPRFAAYTDWVMLYPYWTMPRSILVNEWLETFKKRPDLLRLLMLDVLDSKGRKVDPAAINWASMNARNFPYTIREAPGCQNPLGVLKFHLTGPFNVYLHDTNFKGAFLSKNRYYSHGCVRLQEPIALANALLPSPVDTAWLEACFKDQEPLTLRIPDPVPVFVVYMPAECDKGGEMRYFKDVYKLEK